MRIAHVALLPVPLARAWAVLENIAGWPRWKPTVRAARALNGPGLASERRFALRQPMQPEAVWRVTAVEPGHAFRWRTERRTGVGGWAPCRANGGPLPWVHGPRAYRSRHVGRLAPAAPDPARCAHRRGARAGNRLPRGMGRGWEREPSVDCSACRAYAPNLRGTSASRSS